MIGLPAVPSWSLAIATTLAVGILAHRAGSAGHWVHYSGLLLVIILAACIDGVNLEDAVRQNHSAKAEVAKVETRTASAGLATLASLVTGEEEAIRESRKALEAELANGGIGPKARAMIAKVEAREAALSENKAKLAQAEISAAAMQVAAVRTESGVHVLATYPRWSLYLGALALELIAAAVAYGQGCAKHRRAILRGQGRPRKRKPRTEPRGTQGGRITPVILNRQNVPAIRQALETIRR